MKKCCCERGEERTALSSYLPAFVDQLDKGETCILLDGVLPFLQANTRNISDGAEITLPIVSWDTNLIHSSPALRVNILKKTTRANVMALHG